MSIRTGFAEVDITPPVGISKIGWIKDIKSDEVLDPLYAHVAVLESQGETVAFVQLDTLTVRWTQTHEIRERVAAEYGYPGEHVLVAATHNHAGPAVANGGEVKMDVTYTNEMVGKVVRALGEALEAMEDAEVGLGGCFDFEVAHNRRVIMRDGTVRTHGNFNDPDALCFEGPIDPEVAVLAARAKDGRILGAIVNYACHPTHHGGGAKLSAGYPGVLAATMKHEGCPVTLFLNGACGNIHTSNPAKGGKDMPMEEAGQRLAADAMGVIEGLTFRDTLRLGSRLRTIQLPYREITDDEIKGTTRGAQRFVDPAIYDRVIPDLVARIKERKTQPAEVQAHFVDEYAFVTAPCELFVQLGLRIKEGAYPRHALVVGYANGNVGYVPHTGAFLRGGYETTFGPPSRVAPGAGEMLVDCALELIRLQDAV